MFGAKSQKAKLAAFDDVEGKTIDPKSWYPIDPLKFAPVAVVNGSEIRATLASTVAGKVMSSEQVT